MEYFLIYSAQIKNRGLDIGFDLYEPGHLLWLAAILIIAGLAASRYKKARPRSRSRVRKAFAVILLLSEILKDTVIALLGADMIEYLPLHLCSFTILIMLLDAFGPWRDFTGQLLAYAMFPGACAALLFCNWTEYPFFNYMNIHSFAFHGWIVIYFFMIYAGGEVRVRYKGLWQTVLAMIIVSIPVYIFNLNFDTNYLFLNEASEGSPLVIVWDIFGTRLGAPGYLAGIVLMVLLIFHALYLIYRILEQIREQRIWRARSVSSGRKNRRQKEQKEQEAQKEQEESLKGEREER